MRIECRPFNIEQIAESGQCFRMNRIEGQRYGLVALGKYIEINQVGQEEIEMTCDEQEFQEIWKDYFDLDYDYGSIVTDIMKGQDEFLRASVTYGSGIRILRQDAFEMLITFIISQNKNIPSIKACVERICQRYGDRKTDSRTGVIYHTFPSPEQLARATKEELREMKLGYRDEYIMDASRAVAGGRIHLEQLRQAVYEEALISLKTIRGVGEKVANCISLFGLHHIEAFPVDVWIARALNSYYPQGFPIEKYSGYAGIIQQFIFYYIRSL